MAFDVLDSNGDGTLEVDEIKQRFTYTNYENLTKLTVGDEFWPQLLEKFDTSSDGKVTYEQFKSSMLRLLNSQSVIQEQEVEMEE